MNKIILIKIFVLYTFMAHAGNIVVSGKIEHTNTNIVKLNCWQGGLDTEYITTIDSIGFFKIVFERNKAWSYTLKIGSESTPVFLFPGDSVFITIDTRQFDETLLYSGKGSEVNNYLAKQFLYFENNVESQDAMRQYRQKLATTNARTFADYADSICNFKLSYLDQYKDKLPEEFYNFQYADIVFRYACDKSNYPYLYYRLRGIRDSVAEIPKDFFNFYNELPTGKPGFLAAFYYTYFLENKMGYQITNRTGETSFYKTELFDEAAKTLTGDDREHTLCYITQGCIDHGKSEEAGKLYQRLVTEIQDTELLIGIKKRYELVSTLFPGHLAPSFTLMDRNGKQISLSDFRGKIVYMDFWATWCGPCIMEIPANEKLQKTFKGQDIVFLSISIDDDSLAWQNKIKNLNGVHLLAKSINHPIAKTYSIHGVPQYFLIDRKGFIISNQPARPTSKLIENELRKALLTN